MSDLGHIDKNSKKQMFFKTTIQGQYVVNPVRPGLIKLRKSLMGADSRNPGRCFATSSCD